MISSGEANIRKKIGFVVGIAATVLLVIGYSNLPILSLIIGTAIGVYRTGSENFWGCIVNKRWKLDGKNFTKIPEQFASFADEKRRAFFKLMATSVLLTIFVSMGIA